MAIRIKRIYEKPADDDGFRVLIDRLWPRGLKKEQVRFDRWLKEVAPSTELRRWFGHNPAKWQEFKTRYFRELDAQSEAISELVALSEGQTVTLLFGAKAERYSNAAALQEYLSSSAVSRSGGRD